MAGSVSLYFVCIIYGNSGFGAHFALCCFELLKISMV